MKYNILAHDKFFNPRDILGIINYDHYTNDYVWSRNNPKEFLSLNLNEARFIINGISTPYIMSIIPISEVANKSI